MDEHQRFSRNGCLISSSKLRKNREALDPVVPGVSKDRGETLFIGGQVDFYV